LIHLFAKADEKHVADAGGRCAQIAGGPQQMRDQRVIIRPVSYQVELGDLFAASRDKTLHAVKKLQRLGPADAVLVGINFFCLFDVLGLKEPLSFLTRGSGAAVVNPIDLTGHENDSPNIHGAV
jgi:hypothetical protein